MRLYQISKTSGGSCCYCKGGVIKPYAPLKNKTVGEQPVKVIGSGMIQKVIPPSNQPIPNTESLQRKLSNLASIRPSSKRGGKYVSL